MHSSTSTDYIKVRMRAYRDNEPGWREVELKYCDEADVQEALAKLLDDPRVVKVGISRLPRGQWMTEVVTV